MDLLNTQSKKNKDNASGIKSKIRPPRLGGANVGLFSTRTPHRPNPIGISVAKLDRIEKGIIYLSCIGTF
jgi:tRNA (Thr-GGU) A37 N-methylase